MILTQWVLRAYAGIGVLVGGAMFGVLTRDLLTTVLIVLFGFVCLQIGFIIGRWGKGVYFE